MRQICLNLLYAAALAVLSPAIALNGFRKRSFLLEWKTRWLGRIQVPSGREPVIWLHAVSVGEVNLLQPVLQALRRKHPGYRFAISATTASGLKLARQIFPNEFVFRMPLDFSWAIKRTLASLTPELILLAELEVWPNLLAISQEKNIPVAIINGRLSEGSYRGYKRLHKLVAPTFSRLSFVGAQDEEYAKRFRDLGVDCSRVQTTGNIKFDNCNLDPYTETANQLRSVLGLTPSRTINRYFRQELSASGQNVPVWVAGSTQVGEEEMILATYKAVLATIPELRLILVPRHPERFEAVVKLAKAEDDSVVRLSELRRAKERTVWKILVGDTVGDLRWLWSLADIAFVGGSFGDRGGQNMLEPAAYGASVAVGPNTKNFKRVVELLLDADALTQLKQPAELSEWAKSQLSNHDHRIQVGIRAQAVVRQHLGAIDRTLDAIGPLLAGAETSRKSSEGALEAGVTSARQAA